MRLTGGAMMAAFDPLEGFPMTRRSLAAALRRYVGWPLAMAGLGAVLIIVVLAWVSVFWPLIDRLTN